MDKQKIRLHLEECNNLYKRYDSLYRKIARDFEMSESVLFILYFMRIAGGACSQSEICNGILQSKQTVNSAIKKMGEEGLLCLSCREGNKKSKCITLTPAGVGVAEKTADRVIEAEAAAISAMSGEEMERFLELYEKFISLLAAELDGLRPSGQDGKSGGAKTERERIEKEK